MTTQKFWLYGWIDNLGIDNAHQAELLVKDPVALADLRERAAAVPYELERLPPDDGSTLVAGRAIDLSGSLDCLGWDCVKKQVDRLFSRAWHYFDRIVVVGPSAFKISESWKANARAPDNLLSYVKLLLHVREIGAEGILLFRQKPPPCHQHLAQHLKEVGAESLVSQVDSVVERLAKEATVNTRPRADYLEYRFVHPEFEHTEWGYVSNAPQSRLSETVAMDVVRRYLAALVSDLRTARWLDCPLGTTVRLHGVFLNTLSAGFNEGDIAFELKLPVIDGIDVRTLLKLREDQKPSFEKFRRALSVAIRERLKNSAQDKGDVSRIASDIARDVLKPALVEIEGRLKLATKTLVRKTGASILLASFPTAYGLLRMNPFLIAAGFGTTMQSVVGATHKYLEETEEVALSDMFFLWQARRHGHSAS